jgi:hypothetical protein
VSRDRWEARRRIAARRALSGLGDVVATAARRGQLLEGGVADAAGVTPYDVCAAIFRDPDLSAAAANRLAVWAGW